MFSAYPDISSYIQLPCPDQQGDGFKRRVPPVWRNPKYRVGRANAEDELVAKLTPAPAEGGRGEIAEGAGIGHRG